MSKLMSVVAVTALALVGCGGDDSDAGGGSGGGSSDFCETALAVADEFDGLEENVEDENFYGDLASLYQRLGDAASGDLADDFEFVSDAFEQIEKWSQDPTSDYPFTEAEDAEVEAAMNRIDEATQACGVGDDGSSGDGSSEDLGAPADSSDDPSADETDDGTDAGTDAGTDDEMTLTLDDGDQAGEMTFGGDLPDDFPFPVPATYEVGSSFRFDEASGTSFTAVLNTPADDFDQVAELYEEFLNSEGFEVERSDISSGDQQLVFLSGERSDASVAITMSTEEVANDADGNLTFDTVVSMTWTPLG